MVVILAIPAILVKSKEPGNAAAVVTRTIIVSVTYAVG